LSRVLGIDLGTSYSSVAVIDNEHARVIPNREGTLTVPSVVALTRSGKWLAGQAARDRTETHPESTISGFFRLIGRRFDSEAIKEAQATQSYAIVEADNGDAHVQIEDQVTSPQELTAVLLSELKSAAERSLGEQVEEAVIAVPTIFNDNQRQATKDAATIAGFGVRRILNASTAAGLAYGRTLANRGRVAVYDIGGGTFDLSLLELHEGIYEVLATAGDTYLGGEDIDQLVIDGLVEKFREQHNIDLRGDRGARRRLKAFAERAKIELSSTEETRISFPLTPAEPDKTLQTVLSRRDLEVWITPLLERTIEPCNRALKDAHLDPNDIDHVVVIGGQARTPRVAQFASRIFGKDATGGGEDEIVATGAAIQIGIMEGEIPDLVLVDVTPHTLGIETQGGGFAPLIERNSTIPTRKGRIFTTVLDNQSKVELQVLQGESDKAALNTLLGKFELTGIAPARKEVPQIEVAFEIDITGMVKLSARDQASGHELDVTVRSGSGLSKSEIERLRSQFLARSSEQRETAGREVREELQMLVHGVRKALNSVSSVLDANEHAEIVRTLDDAQRTITDESHDLKSTEDRLFKAADILGQARQRLEQ
jgi:molecular chaperone DnaK